MDQNYPNLEFIIIDGGSNDGSQKIIERYSDLVTYWHSQHDAGQTDALIQGFSRATGELIGWFNTDDVLLPGALYHIAQAYKLHPHGGIFAGDILDIDEHGLVIRFHRLPSNAAWFARFGMFALAQPGSFFSRKDYEAVGGLHIELNFVMDLDLYLRMMKNGAEYIKVDTWVSGFRIHPLSKSVLHGSKFPDEYESIRLKYLPWTKPSPLGRYFYIGTQIANGNYLRMLVENIFADGKHWRKWAENKLKHNGIYS